MQARAGKTLATPARPKQPTPKPNPKLTTPLPKSSEDVLLIGTGRRLELWDKERHDAVEARVVAAGMKMLGGYLAKRKDKVMVKAKEAAKALAAAQKAHDATAKAIAKAKAVADVKESEADARRADAEARKAEAAASKR